MFDLPDSIYMQEISDYVTFTDVSQLDQLSSAEIASIVQAAASKQLGGFIHLSFKLYLLLVILLVLTHFSL